MDAQWRIAAPAQLSSKSWDGEIVVYSDRTGNTHHLEAVAAEAFETMMAGPVGEDELTRRIAASLEIPLDDELRSAIRSILDRFRDFDLAEPVSMS